MEAWSGMIGDLYFKREILRISRSLRGLARPLLRASTTEQLDRVVTETMPRYMALKVGLAKLIMVEFSRERDWSPERFLRQYGQACEEAIQIFRKRAPSKLDQERAEILVSAVKGLVLFSKRLLSAGIQGKVRDEQTVLLCLDTFIKADFLLLVSFLVLNGEIRRFEKPALELIADMADVHITEIEDTILSRNFEFADHDETTPLEEYLTKSAR